MVEHYKKIISFAAFHHHHHTVGIQLLCRIFLKSHSSFNYLHVWQILCLSLVTAVMEECADGILN